MYDNNYLYYCIDMDYLIYDRFLNIFPLSGTVYKTYHFFIFDRIFLWNTLTGNYHGFKILYILVILFIWLKNDCIYLTFFII